MVDRRRTRGVVALLAVAIAVRRLRRTAADVPLSPLTAGWRVGADYAERRGIAAEGEVAGELDDLREFARRGFDPDAVARAVRDFYERTADYELVYEAEWHRPFRVGAALASLATSRVEQLNLPGPRESGVRELESRFVPVEAAADPRDGARAWIRTTDDGTAVFVAIYAHHERDGGTSDRRPDGVRYVNIAVPLPGANLSTVLRPVVLETPEGAGNAGIELTTLDGGGNEGLYLSTPVGAVALPLNQRFRVWPAAPAAPDAPADLTGGRASVVATHEMWAIGRQFLTVRYAGWPTEG